MLLLSAGADLTIRVWALPHLRPLLTLRSAGRSGEPLAHDGAIYSLLVVPPTRSPPPALARAVGLAPSCASGLYQL